MHVAIVAGEPSGDMLGAGLLEALKERVPALYASGIGGARMQAAGLESLYPMERLAVMGLVEAAGRYVELVPVRRRLGNQFMRSRPDVFIGIDSPDFNLALERALRSSGIPTVHYVSPSVWAWRRYRLAKIARSVDRMLTLFPFEAQFYRDHGVPVSYVGHPLADEIDEAIRTEPAREVLNLPLDANVVALLPGSRISEVQYLAAPMIRTARWLADRRPGLCFVVPLVDDVTRRCFERANAELGKGLALRTVHGQARTVMSAADVVLLASGTATLEALLVGRPMVITYRTNWLTARIMKAMFQVPWIGLPNLLAGESLVPELLQERAVPDALGPAVLELLDDPICRETQRRALRRIASQLSNVGSGPGGDATGGPRTSASTRAAEAVLSLVAARHGGNSSP